MFPWFVPADPSAGPGPAGSAIRTVSDIDELTGRAKELQHVGLDWALSR